MLTVLRLLPSRTETPVRMHVTSFKGSLANWVVTLQGWLRASREASGAEPFWLVISVGGVVVLTAWFLLASLGTHQIAREHGPMENLQAGLLVGGLLALFYRASQEKIPGMRIARS